MRRMKLFTVVAVLFALIFGQLWVSAYACAAAEQTVQATQGAAVTMSNHDDLRDQHTAAACHLHCNNQAQPDHADLPALSPVVWLPLAWGHSSILERAVLPDRPSHPEPMLLSAPPPHRILFQVFRT
jgi:hypothetical protein